MHQYTKVSFCIRVYCKRFINSHRGNAMNQPFFTQPQQQPETGSGEKTLPLSGTLQSRNVRIHKKRTSIRLEPEMWKALNEIAGIEGCSIHDLCGAVHDLKEPGTSFTAALRVFLMEYYRAASKTSVQISQVQKLIRNHLISDGHPHT